VAECEPADELCTAVETGVVAGGDDVEASCVGEPSSEGPLPPLAYQMVGTWRPIKTQNYSTYLKEVVGLGIMVRLGAPLRRSPAPLPCTAVVGHAACMAPAPRVTASGPCDSGA
jgi:hypothetical protein